MRQAGRAIAALALLWALALPAQAQTPPLSYSAITDRVVRPYVSLPALGSTGFQHFTDPVFGSNLVRVTDRTTRPDRLDRPFYTPASAESTIWNTDSTKFFVTGAGGEVIPFSFVPATMTAARMGNLANGTGGLLLNLDGQPEFSYADPDLINGSSGSLFVNYRFSTGVTTTLHDVHSCLPGIATHGVGTSASHDDARILTYVGGTSQDADTTVYVWDRALGCRYMNTSTGQVGGAWGPTGAYSGDSGFTIHNVRLSRNGTWAKITVGGGGGPAGVYFWNVPTLTLIPCNVNSAPFCPGHFVMGYNKAIDQRGLTDGFQFGIRPMATPSNVSTLINPQVTPTQFLVDGHLTWSNVQPDDAEPVCTEIYRTDDKVERPYDGEMICMRTDLVTTTVWRFAHHRSIVNTFEDQPVANVSQDGRFLAFHSNWAQTLGTIRPGDGTGPRTDVFIVQLAPATGGPPPPPTVPLFLRFVDLDGLGSGGPFFRSPVQ